jgi:hypothetical protein
MPVRDFPFLQVNPNQLIQKQFSFLFLLFLNIPSVFNLTFLRFFVKYTCFLLLTCAPAALPASLGQYPLPAFAGYPEGMPELGLRPLLR